MIQIVLKGFLCRFPIAAMVAEGFHRFRGLFTLAVLLIIPTIFALSAAEPVRPPAPAESGTRPNRLSVAILGFENKTGDPTAENWGDTLDRFISDQLGEVKALRVAYGVGYGLRQINRTRRDSFDEIQARKVGEIIEARRVIWGDYQRKGNQWLVTVRVLNVATGKSSKKLSATSTDWFEIRDKLTEQILKELGVSPTGAERKKMLRRFTDSPVALEWLSKAAALEGQSNPEAQLEFARRAVEADPKCPEAHACLAAVLGTQGKIDEAEESIRRALSLEPDYARARQVLGIVLLLKTKNEEAARELKEAARLDPDDSETFKRLGELYDEQDSAVLAIDHFIKALRLDPFSASVHAHLGRIYGVQGKREKALAELNEAERVAAQEDADTEQHLGVAYQALEEWPSAVEHYEKFVALARKQGWNPKLIDEYAEACQSLKARLVPTYLTAVAPKQYTGKGLEDALREKLTSNEFRLVTSPIASTPEMDRWARELTAGATNELQNAKTLFDALERRADGTKSGNRNAREVFQAWNPPEASFRCQEYAWLYVALARSIGLKTYNVFVEEECDGSKGLHACAGVFIGDKVLLVDPTYHWFGAPHKKFRVLDDVQSAAVYLDGFDNLKQAQIAVKLAPELAFVNLRLFLELTDKERWQEANEVSAAVLRLDPDGWMANVSKGKCAVHEGKLQEAAGLLRRAIEMEPDLAEIHALLGECYLRQGKLKAARESYRNALACANKDQTEKAHAENMRQAIAQLNESIIEYSDDVESDPKSAKDFLYRGDIRAAEHNFDLAISDFSETLRLDPKNAGAYTHRGCAYYSKSEFDRAIREFTEAIRLNPNDVLAYDYRSDSYYKKAEFEKSLADLREAIRINPKDGSAYNQLAWILVNCPTPAIRDAKAAVEAGRKACELTDWKEWRFIDVLASALAAANEFEQAARYQTQALSMDGPGEEDRRDMRKRLLYYTAHLPAIELPKP